MTRYTFSFRNMTFGTNSNRNIPSRHYSSTSSSSNQLNRSNLVDIPQIQMPPIIESNQISQENQNFPSQHQINSYGRPSEENIQEILPPYQEHEPLQQQFDPQVYYDAQPYQNQEQMIYESQYLQNNDIFEVPAEYQNNMIYQDYNQYQNFQSQPQLFFQPNFRYQAVEQNNLLHPQNQYQYQNEDFQPNTQDITDIKNLNYPHSQNQIAYENLHSNLRPKSKYENIIDGLQPYNEYQTIIDESLSEPQYDANDFLNMEPLPTNKLDRLINRINEQILKQNELNEWFKNSVDKQTRMIEELKEISDEQKEISNNQNKLMEQIFEFMKHIEKK